VRSASLKKFQANVDVNKAWRGASGPSADLDLKKEERHIK